MHFTTDDAQLADRYPDWSDKGPVKDGRRLTIMTTGDAFGIDEEVRVLHVVEAVEPQVELYLMGPKEVHDEYVDGVRQNPLPDGVDPFVPLEYDGRVATGPAVDFNYDVTTYRFTTPGEHEIVWRLGGWTSNTLRLSIG